ncbi:MAG: hypothetical protein D3915_01195 [Candidatus Electrothrix sp. AU1_5]|nr:hypothetical protein [Candidatus Electrothrix gigas]
MEITFRLSDEIVRQLRKLKNPDQFVGDALRKALLDASLSRRLSPSGKSKWAKIAERIEQHPVDLKGYSAQLQKDMRAFREDFSFCQELQQDHTSFKLRDWTSLSA